MGDGDFLFQSEVFIPYSFKVLQVPCIPQTQAHKKKVPSIKFPSPYSATKIALAMIFHGLHIIKVSPLLTILASSNSTSTNVLHNLTLLAKWFCA